MNNAERLQRMNSRKISIDAKSKNLVKNKVIIVIDDVYVTGSHEKTIKLLLNATEAKSTVYCYFLKFSEKLATNEPEAEDFFNHAKIKTYQI